MDLPHPLGPINAILSPSWTLKLILSSKISSFGISTDNSLTVITSLNSIFTFFLLTGLTIALLLIRSILVCNACALAVRVVLFVAIPLSANHFISASNFFISCC